VIAEIASAYIDVVFYMYASSEMLVFIHNKPAGKCYVVFAGLHGCVMQHKNLVRLQGFVRGKFVSLV